MVAGHLQEKMTSITSVLKVTKDALEKRKTQVGSHRSVRQEEQEESRGSFAGTSAELHGSHRTCGDSLGR